MRRQRIGRLSRRALRRPTAWLAGAALVMLAGAPSAASAPRSAAVDYLHAPVTETQVLDWGHRPVWSPDGTKLAFLGLNHHFGAGFAYELDLATGAVRCLTCHLANGEVLRIYYLPDGSFLTQAPATPLYSATGVDTSVAEHFNCSILGKEHQTGLPTDAASRPFRCELYWLPATLDSPPQPLGVHSFEEVAIASDRLHIAWVVPASPATPEYQIWTGDLAHDGTHMELTNRKQVFRTFPNSVTNPPTMGWAEVMDFFPSNNELLFYATVFGDEGGHSHAGDGEVFALELATGTLTNHSKNPAHDEAHLFFPNATFALNERDGGLWALQLDGTGQNTREFARGIAAVSSPDGRRVAYNKTTTGAGGLWIAEFRSPASRQPSASRG